MIDHQTVEPLELVALLKEKQQTEGLSLGQLERGTGVTRQSLRSYFSGNHLPISLKTKKKLAEYLNGTLSAPDQLVIRRRAAIEQLEANMTLTAEQRIQAMEDERWRQKYLLLLEVVKDLLR